MERLLTKSRFKLGLSCPNKLFYTKKKEYANTMMDDPFLEALAQGGFQVEELARMEYPDGFLIEGNDWNYNLLVEQTTELLQRENVVIFEAAFRHENLFIRTDILVKKGNKIKLIEVKAKSYNPFDENIFIGKRGGMVPSWKPYLFDVAFQNHVIAKSYPHWEISSFLMMANKLKPAQIDGLNQLFRISSNSENRTGIIKKVQSIEEIGESPLGRINIDQIVSDIQSGKHKCFEEMDFKESIQLFSKHYSKDKKFNYPVSYGNCKSCEFKCSPEEEQNGMKSGFKECWKEQKGWTEREFNKPNTFELWNFRKGSSLFENSGLIFLEELTEDDLNVIPQAGKISASERQWIQTEKAVQKDNTPYILKEELKEEISSWKFPLNMIDFETSAVALPFNKGRKPYEQIAFQFSHHTIDETGKVKHVGEFIDFKPGNFPNFDFVRALKQSLEQNNGTIFRYSNHENSILNAIYNQLEDSDEADKTTLQDFIQQITHSKSDSVEKWCGKRDMVDLCEVVKKYYYDPYMVGSNSIKVVLPAVLKRSKLLKKKYTKTLQEADVTSLNFPENHVWFQFKNEELLSPYKILPALFDGWSDEQIENTISELTDINNGGAALTAYGKLQYTDMTSEERFELKSSLLKYCELDTLAMVMIYEYFKEVI